ncbi:hypothetical protein FEM48_Zijuj06G0160500 [Ziziphus jujuba var. spinosa]|uniref:Uncharacterized protein n=1 Tax=Ziziphus jujuba var. spinosa TaxID=714518 RepID=A0A978VA93_ZIZJJ|nr:hypothetical protein FEM48_Zijuj06G0160500 [Ziziphus jujuba var. spinosa]
MATSNSANSPSTNTSPSPSPTTIDVYHNNTPLSPSDDTLIIINIASQAPLKLTAQKYSFWHSQWFSHLYGCNLKGYVDGTRDCYTDRDTSNPSLTFEQSHTLRQVHLLHSTLMASFSPGRIMGLRESLSKTTKASQNISSYMQIIQTQANALAMAGAPLIDDEIGFHIIKNSSSEITRCPMTYLFLSLLSLLPAQVLNLVAHLFKIMGLILALN